MDTPAGDPEIVRADPRLRRRSTWAAALVFVLGVVAIAALRHRVNQIELLAAEARAAAIGEMLRLTGVVAWVGGLAGVAAGLWLWVLGRRINRAERFPPPGMKVVRDTPVRRGRQARAVANIAQLLGTAVIILSSVGMWRLYHLAATLLR